MRSKQILGIYLLILCFVAPIFLLRMNASLEQKGLMSRVVAQHNAVAKYDSEVFFTINDEAGLSNITQAIQLKIRDREPETTAKDLIRICRDFFVTYNRGTYSNYFRFKTQDLPFDYNFSGAAVDALSSIYTNRALNIPTDSKEKRAEVIWELTVGGSDKSGTLIAVAPQTLAVEVSVIPCGLNSTNRAVAKLWAKYPASTYVRPFEDLITHGDNQLDKVCVRNGGLRVAFVTFVAHVSTTESAVPFAISFYWIPEAKRWLPWEMALTTDAGNDFDVLF